MNFTCRSVDLLLPQRPKKGKIMNKNNNMYPSEKTRKFGLMTTGTRGMKLMKYGFGVLGTSIFLTASLVSLITMIFGKEENHTVSFVLFLVFLAAALLYAAIGFFIFPAVSKKLDDGKNTFVIDSGSAVAKEELFADMNSIREPFTAERNGDWLDVTWKWLSGYYADMDMRNPGGYKRREFFKIMFRVNDDHTYDMLDCVVTEMGGVNRRGIDLTKSVSVGRFKLKKFFGALGVDESSGKAGPNSYHLDTEELRRYMRKWFADRGYREN